MGYEQLVWFRPKSWWGFAVRGCSHDGAEHAWVARCAAEDILESFEDFHRIVDDLGVLRGTRGGVRLRWPEPLYGL